MPLVGHRTILRFIYFLGVVRWYNLILIGISQYLLAAYVLLVKNGSDKKMAFWQFLTDTTVHSMALATIFTVAAIFIINSFYDLDKDSNEDEDAGEFGDVGSDDESEEDFS